MARINATQIKTCVARLAPQPDEHILDAGFGPGIGIAALASAAPGIQVAGADPSQAMLTAAARRNRHHGDRIRLHQATAAKLPWADDTFDAVCATNSVQLWKPLPESVTEVLRVLRPGGRLVLSVHERAVLPSGGCAGPHYDQMLTPALTQAGFGNVQGDWQPSKGGHAFYLHAQKAP